MLFNTSRQSKMHFILHGKKKKKVQHKNKYKTVYLVGWKFEIPNSEFSDYSIFFFQLRKYEYEIAQIQIITQF